MTFTSYWPLLLLATIPCFWWIRQQSRTDLSARHLELATTIRSMAVFFLVGALMQPVWTQTGSWLSVLYVLDVSQSVAPQDIVSAMNWIEDSERTGAPDHSRFVPFARNAFVFDDLSELREVPVGEVDDADTIDQRATNLAGALDLASRSFASDHLKHLVLLSDGNENSGSVRASLTGLRDQGINIYTRSLSSRVGPDSWIEAVQAPRTVTEDELFPIEVHVYSQDGGAARVTIQDEREPNLFESRLFQ